MYKETKCLITDAIENGEKLSKRRIFFEKYPVFFYLIYIPLAIILLGFPIGFQHILIYRLITGHMPLDKVEGWFWLIMVGSWLTIPIYGIILVLINWILQDYTEEEKGIDRQSRSQF